MSRELLGSFGYGLGSGHSYILYGPLLNRNTTIIFEGKPIKNSWYVLENNFEHKVGTMFTATAIRAIKKEDPTENSSNNMI
jgi:propionyl-CoA synthetase